MKVKSRRGIAWLAAACTLTLLTASRVDAQTKPGTIKNPPEATIRRVAPARFGAEATATQPDSPVGREARLTLVIEMTAATIFNPANRDPQHPEGQPEQVRLRSYRSVPPKPPDPATPLPPFVAPTIRVFPGETVRITLQNKLPPEPGCDPKNINEINEPHCFNATNLHAHGVWVSPAGNSDNVLLTIRPDVTFDYEYNIPADHPAGTFWYHPHRHGSTAMQVGSGMAGALIIQGERLPSKEAPGDLDTLLRAPDGTPFRERVLLFQQIAYACRDDPNGPIKKNANGWICDQAAQNVGQVDKHSDIFELASTWARSGRHTTINGRTAEPFDEPAIAGQLERWRMVHGGVRATLGVRIRKRRPDAKPYDASSAAAEAAWINDNCNASNELPYWEIASDGLTRAAADPRMLTVLQPGYRSDVLIVFPEAGDYCVIDGPVPKEASVSGTATTPRLLTTLTVNAGAPVPDITEHVTQALKTAARTFMPVAMRADIERDLDNGLRLTAFAPHADLPAPTVATQQLTFGLVPPGIGDGRTHPPPTIRPRSAAC